MAEDTTRKTYFAKCDYRGKEKVFGIKAVDRSKHIYVIGKTGMGKTVLLQNMAVQDVQNGNGMAFIDPHGEVTASLLDYIPEERVGDVIHFAPFDMEHPISFNVMEDVGYDKRHLVVSGLISTFKKIWPDVWSARMEYILGNVLFALLEYPDSTLLDVNRMLVNKEFRKDVIAHITDPVVKSFWVDEFANYTDRYTQDATPAIQNKIGQFVSNPLIRNIIGQPKSSFDFREAMDAQKILIINLSKGRIGDTNAKLLGSMLIIKIYLAAMSRADTTALELAKLPPFYFFVDEFQSFANETFADILSESRKYKLSLTIAHQYIGQMPDEVREAVFGNVGTIIVFRVGAEDAEVLEKEFAPTFMAEDLVNLGYYQIYLKLMIDGLASKPFSAVTLPPIEKPARPFKEEVLQHSRKTYARPRAEVESNILERHTLAPQTEKSKKEFKSARSDGHRGASGPMRKAPLEEGAREYAPAPQRRPDMGRGERGYSADAPFRSRGEYPRPQKERRESTRAPLRPSMQRVSLRETHQPARSAGGPFRQAFGNASRPPRDERFQNREGTEERERIKDGRMQRTEPQMPARPAGKRAQRPVSLNTLRRGPKKPEAPSQNADELRKTLEAALRQTETKETPKIETPREQQEQHVNKTSEKPQVENKREAIPEVPEADLKKMLDINSGDKN